MIRIQEAPFYNHKKIVSKSNKVSDEFLLLDFCSDIE
ncbi:hypothetical protein HNQ54_001229 [Anaerocolumna cellulosilytica]|nr:hypothetical protein [Anaerocolumna cellulosilytica]